MNIITGRKLKDWRTFIKIVENKSVTAAADALNIEVSTASKYLTQLEEEMGMVLIERNTRNMSVTPQGREVYERMKVIMGDIDDLYNELCDEKRHMAGTLRIAAPAIVCEFHLSEFIVDFQRVHEKARFHLHAVGRHEEINPADFDMIIRGGTPVGGDLIHRRMDNLNLIVCASPEYLDSREPICHPKDLINHELLALWDHTFSGDVCFTKGDEEDYTLCPPPGRFTTNNVLAQFNLMLRGAGISVATPSWLAYDHIKKGKIVQVLSDWKIQEYEVYMLWKPRKYYSPLLKAFAEYLDVRWRERKKISEI